MNHRAVRINERLAELVSKAEKNPIRVRDIQDVQKDTLDV